MTIPSATKNAWLDGQAISHASLHSAYPGTTGDNELSGGSPAYARKAVTVAAASGGSRILSGAVSFDVPASTVKWIGWWNSSTFLFATANGGAIPKNFVVVPSTDTVYATDHQYSNTQKIVFFGSTPSGLTEGTTYYVRDAATDTFKVAASSGGTAIDLTSGAGFGCVVVAITEDVYIQQGTHTLSAFTETIPD